MDLDLIKQRAKAFDHLFDAVVVTDTHGVIIDWNRGSEVLYGYTKDEAIGQPVSILHVPEDIDHITEDVISTIAKSGKWTGEVRMLHKSGRIGWIESMCVPILDENNQMLGALGINRDITDRVQETERLNNLAYYDQLTEIPNRYLLLERVSHLITQSERNDNSFALLYIDLDEFKIINDTQGHAFGDQLLKQAASRIEQTIRHSDTLARIGGDEFVLLLENTSDKDDVLTIAKNIIEISSKAFFIDNIEVMIGCSIGIAIYPDDGNTVDALLATADKAMYKAKSMGRNTFSF